MQNAFPHLLSLSLVAPFLLRMVAGAYFVIFGYKGMTNEWWERFEFFKNNKLPHPSIFATGTAVADMLGGVMLMMGLWTQIVAMALFIVCVTAILIKYSGEKFPKPDISIYILLSIILISVFITGSGYYGMDIPL